MNTIQKGIVVGIAGLIVLVMPAFAATTPQAQTNSASNIQNTSATLNGNLYDLGGDSSATVWFQYGTSTSYGSETTHNSQNSTGNFSQTVSTLAQNTQYHFRAVAQNSYSTIYGQDMSFTTGTSGSSRIIVNAGQDLYLNAGQSSTLQGSGYDTSGNAVNYSWSCTGGNLSQYNAAQPTYTAPYVSGQTTYTCTLTVSNNAGNSNSDSATVYVNNNGGNGNFSVQTNNATNTNNNQVTLNGSVSGGSSTTNTWFQYGTSTSYGYTTSQQQTGYSGSFSQNVTNLSTNTTYHYRAVAQSNGQTMYGEDATFVINGTGGSYGSGTLGISKQVINLSSGPFTPSSNAVASPYDIVRFTVTLQAGNQDIHNVVVRDSLPNGLSNYDNVMVTGNSYNYSGNDIVSGITLTTIPANQTVTITYQAQVKGPQYFTYGNSTLTNNATVTSTEAGTQTASATVTVQTSLVSGATHVSTGLTNNIFNDSFFIPLIVLLAAWGVARSKLFTSLEKVPEKRGAPLK
jgi:hypothetical protein